MPTYLQLDENVLSLYGEKAKNMELEKQIKQIKK